MINLTGAPSIEDRLNAVRRRPSGFDYMRVALALMVFLVYTVQTATGKDADNAVVGAFGRPIIALILLVFFALSGFLVASSLQRCRTLITFFGLRILRIVPALTFATLISALVLGPIFTTLDLGQYFRNPTFFSYFLNILGDVHYYLPATFTHNPNPSVVNAQPWIPPLELKCCILLGATSFLALAKPSRSMLLLLLLFYVS